MIDLEKVIKGLEETEIMLKQAVDRGGEMAVMGAFKCYNHVSDAIALLKEQEPHKKGYWKYPQSLDCCCSECGNQPDREPGESVPLYNYCPYCGAEMAVMWD